MNREANEMLTRVGPGTPMGELFRRFWLPALLSSEVGRDSPPVRIRILSEDLLAFRDSSGRLGIVDAYCSHRGAPLYFGRNEDDGLRCPYHGWKFDVRGNCLDQPNVTVAGDRDAGATRKAAAIKSYATREAGGVVWIYMGPSAFMPELPAFEWTAVPEGYRHISRWVQRSNWAQGMEGEIDTAHISWLHKEFVPGHVIQSAGADHGADGAPKLALRETDYGFVYGARRTVGDQYLWRVTQWMLPMFSLIPKAPDEVFTVGGGRAWVPIDDNHTTTFCYWYRVDRPYTNAEVADLESGFLFPPRLERGRFALPHGYSIDTFLPIANLSNDYLIDRVHQKTANFTGIRGANEQDRAVQEGMRSIGTNAHGTVDRTRERLVASDLAIVTARRRLLKLAEDLQNGVEPAPRLQAEQFRVRAISRLCQIEDFDELMRRYGDSARAPACFRTRPSLSQS
ncbi:MAG: Rieske 2Fe-2S domain-containing protein [Burkholderiales bacterium]